MLLFSLVSVTNVRKDVEHFTQAVDGTEDDGHHYWHHDYREYRLFNNSNMVFSRSCERLILP